MQLIIPTKSLALLAAMQVTVLADGCHDSNDSIGRYCRYFSDTTFKNAAATYCNPSDGHVVIQGQSYNFKTANNDDGAGGTQIFWGNYRVDRYGGHTITSEECNDYMGQILARCGGYGGWLDTHFGTVFGECIRE